MTDAVLAPPAYQRKEVKRLEEMLQQYRESTDPQEVERLGDELGSMIFAR